MSDILMRKVAIPTMFIQQTDNIQHVLAKSIQSRAEVMGNCQCGSYYLSMRWKLKWEIKCEQVRRNINRAEEGLEIRAFSNTHTHTHMPQSIHFIEWIHYFSIEKSAAE